MVSNLAKNDLKNRLEKRNKHVGKWARRQALEAYRIYEKDLKEFPYIVDRYGDFLHVSAAFKEERQVDEEKDQILIDLLTEITKIPQEKIALKNRKRQKGDDQYNKLGESENTIIIKENGLKFHINLWDYLDTGLFLDHRLSRALIGEKSLGKRVLNLFCYTGSFSVYAAMGGALSVTSLDLSNTYLNWTKSNFKLNGLDNPLNQFIQADALAWVRQAKPKLPYDLIVLDPPTFSNSKKMEGVLDVQRDHKWLIEALMSLLSPEGELFFSNNFRRFQIDPGLENLFNVKETTKSTTPQDFLRNPHKSYWITNKNHRKLR